MKTKTTPIIISNVMISEMNKTLTFREITEPDELEKVFRFRYEEYSNSKCNVFLKQNYHKVDIDIYDLHSKHYGLFAFNNQLVGCLRVVLDRNGLYNQNVFEIGKKYDVFNDSFYSKEVFKSINAADFPFLSYSNLPESMKSHYCLIKRNNENVAEASRLIIGKDFRGLRVSIFLVECAMMLFTLICLGQRHAVLDCCREHRSFYERFGFRPFDDGQGYKIFERFSDILYLHSSAFSIPIHLKLKFEQMAIEFSQTNKISRAI